MPSPELYLAWSAIGLPSAQVRRACLQAMDRHAEEGAGAIPWLLEQSAAAADAFATLVGGQPGTVARTGSTSEGIVAVAQMTPWQPGDTVVLFEGEFPANRTPWLQVARQHQLRVVEVDAHRFTDPERGLAALDQALRHGARMVAVSAVQFQTGLRMPIDAIARRAHEAGAQIFVDGIQAAGSVPIDVRSAPIDWLAAGGHKWLGAPIGTGFLYGRPEAWGALRPHLASWLSHHDPLRFLREPDARPDPGAFSAGPALVEGGMRNHPGLAAARPALEALLRRDLTADVQQTQAHYDAWEALFVHHGFASLRAPHPSGRSGILSFRPPSGHSAASLVDAFARHHVHLTAPDGLLRLAAHPTTTPPEATDHLRVVLESVLSG